MMIRKILVAFILLIPALQALAQKDPVAGSILEKFSEKALSSPSITISFSLVTRDEVNSEENNTKGILAIKKNLYKLEMADNIVWFDGKSVWTLTPDVDEVTVTYPDTSGASFLSSPEKLFTLYREGYKYRLLEEKAGGSIIDLYPEDFDAEFVRIRLLITSDYKLSEAEYKRKDGYSMIISIDDYSLNKKYDDNYFTFDRSKYKNVDIIDMR